MEGLHHPGISSLITPVALHSEDCIYQYAAGGCKDVQYKTRQYARFVSFRVKIKVNIRTAAVMPCKRGSGVSHNDVKCHASVVLGQQG
jgi:hypothetical protein